MFGRLEIFRWQKLINKSTAEKFHTEFAVLSLSKSLRDIDFSLEEKFILDSPHNTSDHLSRSVNERQTRSISRACRDANKYIVLSSSPKIVGVIEKFSPTRHRETPAKTPRPPNTDHFHINRQWTIHKINRAPSQIHLT